MAERKLNVVELTDEELGSIQGGYNKVKARGHFYKYTGTDLDNKYLCPNCGKPVHQGAGWRFYCDPCDESWFLESRLLANLDGGGWQTISRSEFERLR